MKDFLIDPLKDLKSYRGLIEDIEKGLSPIASHGIVGENLGHIVYGLNRHLNKKILLITNEEKKARKLYEEVQSLGAKKARLFTKKEVLFYDIDASSHEDSKNRLAVLADLERGDNYLTISSIEALSSKIIAKEVYDDYVQLINYDTTVNLEDLSRRLVVAGYKRVHMVENIGQFSLRGGIIDIFPPDSLHPYRVELFDDEVDSLRSFDLMTQRSIEELEEIKLSPVEEVLITHDIRAEVIKNLEKDLEKYDKNERAQEKFRNYLELLKEEGDIVNKNMILPYIPRKYLGSLLDYLDQDSLVFLDEPERIKEDFKSIEDDMNYKYMDLLEAGEILPSHVDLTWKYDDLLKFIKKKKIVSNSGLLKADRDFPAKALHNFTVKSTTPYHNKMGLLVEDLKHYQYRGYKIIILSGTEERGLRLQESLGDLDIRASFYKEREEEIKSGQIFISPGSIEDGFEDSAIKLIVISDKEIFGSQKKKRTRLKRKKGEKIVNLNDLEVGSFIVHENHGIGRYEGIEQLDIQGSKKDYLTIRYKGQDKLYIPIDQMNLIQKYVGSDTAKPKISRLNSGEWQRTKSRAKKAVENMAEDLLNLYAKRESEKGYAFSEDSLWQRQFEDDFHYEETEGQLISINEIKKDMEEDKPMDRLLCGDVGYGKTEVALRAAFKALMDGKQVAILVPTTILAQQHYNTMVERFGDFPIKTGLLSRFKSPKEQERIIDGLERGRVDIVVGTHRLLSKDVVFKDLGLLIIDEEQRFGVKHKEKLKRLRENVDVLTLTATPIPRTLHMSMVGIRDMSVIEDPPAERYPIQTYVLEYNRQMIREAILKEIARGGQVYFVYNRVETIDRIAQDLSSLVPEARFAVGHGQMGEKQLERVMMDFIDQEQDVLVCTTIIETGLDIPNVNTMIVYDADKMGLSQLYQLRGRVGRSTKIAYGYFTYEKDKVLTEVAEKRLRAIKEFTEFGSGFKIAMRDLEIRGAGNLLGLEQHGHIGAIGYDLYVKFLGEAIRKLKGEKVTELLDTAIDINVDGYIPANFIENEELKLDVYKKIAAISDLDDYSELLDELIDRFGDLPKVVENLMNISYIKALASRNGIKSIDQANGLLKLSLESTENISPELIHLLSGQYGRAVNFDLSSQPYITLRASDNSLGLLKELVETINDHNKAEDQVS